MLDLLVSHTEYIYEGFWISTSAYLVIKERNYVTHIEQSQSSFSRADSLAFLI